MKILALTTFLTATFWVAVAQAQEVRIGAGSPTGEYTNTIVPAISKALSEYGYTAVAVPSAGSQENIDNVMAGKLVAALTQLDVAGLNMTVEKDPDETLVLLGGKIAPEALFCAANKNGSIRSYDDLTDEQDKPLRVSVGPEGSGTAKTMEYLMTLDPDLSTDKVRLIHKSKRSVEINRLLSGRRDLVCFVMAPNPENDLIKMVVEHDDLMFINIDNPAFKNAKVNGISLYDTMEVPVGGGFLGINTEKITTLVTWVGVVANEEQIDEGVLDALSKVVLKPDLLPDTSVAGKAKKLMDDFTSLFQ